MAASTEEIGHLIVTLDADAAKYKAVLDSVIRETQKLAGTVEGQLRYFRSQIAAEHMAVEQQIQANQMSMKRGEEVIRSLEATVEQYRKEVGQLKEQLKDATIAQENYNKVAKQADPVLKENVASHGKLLKSMEATGKSMMQFGSRYTLFITAPIVAAGVSFAKTAADAAEIASKFDVVFSEIKGEAESMARTLDKSYGMSSIGAKRALADTADLLAGFGFSQSEALKMSGAVQKLAVDLASFQNYSGGAAGAAEALSKGLLGEREMMKSLGIAILETDVQNRVALNNAKGLTFENERLAKAYATLQLATEQSKNAVGDYARTSQSAANQQRELLADVEDLRTELGTQLLPIYQDVLATLRDWIQAFNNLTPETKKFLVEIAGAVAILGPVSWALGGLLNIASKFGTAIYSVGQAFKWLGGILGVTGAGWAAVIAGMAAVAKLYYDWRTAAQEAYDPEIIKLKETTDLLERQNKDMEAGIKLREDNAKAIAAASRASYAKIVEEETKAYDKAMEARAEMDAKVKKVVDGLRLEIATFGESSEAAKVHALAIEGASKAQLAEAQALAQQLEGMKHNEEAIKHMDKIFQKSEDERKKRIQKQRDEAQKVAESMRTPTEKYAATAIDLVKLLRVGALGPTAFSRAIQAARKDAMRAMSAGESYTAPREAVAAGSAAARQRVEEYRARITASPEEKAQLETLNRIDEKLGILVGKGALPPEASKRTPVGIK